jgi:peptidoglycan/xylan/chitin deacetylase (PgdA/CDA1 family)
MAGPVIDILMYHSISEGAHPTQIAPSVFAEQIEAIAASGVPVIGLDAVADGLSGKTDLAPRSVVITFDDAFQDFADAAWPILKCHGFAPVVYVPTGHVGGHAGWPGASEPHLPIMGWDTIRALAADGIDFQSHSVTHPDLTQLDATDLESELRASKDRLEHELGHKIAHFAPPYGASNDMVLREINTHYTTSCGTRLDSAHSGSSRLDLPRLEMYYFKSPLRVRQHMAGRGDMYVRLRKGLRRIRRIVAP